MPRAESANLLVVALVSGCLAGNRLPPRPPRTSSLGLTIATFTLRNGLRTVLVSDPKAADVQVTVRFQVGAVDDPPERPGTAHLVEHLMFDHQVDGQHLAERLDAVATSFNATTTLDATTFFARASPDKLGELLAIEAARLTSRCSAIDDGEFTRERDVVVNELVQRDHASEIRDLVELSAYPEGHPYHRRVGGTLDVVRQITRAQACSFADTHYSVGNAVLVVSGNLTRQDLEAAVANSLAKIARRDFTAQQPVTEPPFKPGRVELQAPIDDPAFILAWPLPDDPKQRAKYRALLATAVTMIDAHLDGSATVVELGDTSAPMIGLLVTAFGRDTQSDLINVTDEALGDLPRIFEKNQVKELDPLAFGMTQHSAIFRHYALLGDARVRDPLLAAYEARGRDPGAELRAELAGLSDFKRDEAIEIARDNLRYSKGIALVLRPSNTKKTGRRVVFAATPDTREPSLSAADPSAAHQPIHAAVASVIPGTRTRRLANGLQVVLLPVSSVPTIDIRMVFAAGTGDEPDDKRGVAILAAQALRWDLQYVKDLLLFGTAGGIDSVDVGPDHTTFAVHGTDNQLDYLLAGLRRWVRDGRYDDSIDEVTRRIRHARARPDVAAASNDAWRASLYGAAHPYAKAGLLRLASEALDDEDAIQFRRDNYEPDNATLVIAGHFDPDTANRWVDFLFADWQGRAKRRGGVDATLAASSIATIADTAQVQLDVALPASGRNLAAKLVAAQMLSELASGIRNDLGAAYDVSAELGERRLSTAYFLGGSIDASRAAMAVKLLKDWITRLRQDQDFAARLFVIARAQVLARLHALSDHASDLSDRIVHDVELGRAVFTDVATQGAVRDLTVDQMTPVLADFDLAKAAVAMRGPGDDMRAAFDVLGRKPTTMQLAPPPDANSPEPMADPATFIHAYRDTTPRHLADALTNPQPIYHFALTVSAGGSLATISRSTPTKQITDSCLGPTVVAEAGVRRREALRLGLRVGVASLSGTDMMTNDPDTTFNSFDVGPFVQWQVSGRFWVGGAGGIRFERDVTSSSGGFFGAQLGLDLISLGRNWLGLFGRYELVTGTENGMTTLGVAFRH